jgi:hypothetical protein
MVPLLAANDVKRAVAALNHEIDAIISNSIDDTTPSRAINFDSSEYFFVSRRVAGLFPSLWESEVVMSYRSIHPPHHLRLEPLNDATNKAAVKFQGSSAVGVACNLARAFLTTLSTIALLFGTVNIHLQKAIITVFQPAVLAGICYAYYDIVNGSWIIAVACVIVVGGLYLQFRSKSAAVEGVPAPPTHVRSNDSGLGDAHGRGNQDTERNSVGNGESVNVVSYHGSVEEPVAEVEDARLRDSSEAMRTVEQQILSATAATSWSESDRDRCIVEEVMELVQGPVGNDGGRPTHAIHLGAAEEVDESMMGEEGADLKRESHKKEWQHRSVERLAPPPEADVQNRASPEDDVEAIQIRQAEIASSSARTATDIGGFLRMLDCALDAENDDDIDEWDDEMTDRYITKWMNDDDAH